MARSVEQFITDSNRIHENKYEYSAAAYNGTKVKVKIVCKIHGIFEQTPDVHLRGHGCFKCMCDKRTKPLEQFIREAREIHGAYDYSNAAYINAHTKIKIICKLHGEFIQTPDDHLSGKRCPSCASSVSRQETEWLNSLNIPIEYRHKTLYIGKIKVQTDAYNPSTNTIYEYNGDFWHGNPEQYNQDDINPRNKKTFGKLYEETKLKRKLILDAGYSLIEIWGSDWEKIKNMKEI